MKEMPNYEQLLTGGQVAKMLTLDPKTVARWAKIGLIQAIVLPSGHRRYRRTDVDALLNMGADPDPTAHEVPVPEVPTPEFPVPEFPVPDVEVFDVDIPERSFNG